MEILIENRLLGYDNEQQTYRTTNKGSRFMRIYNQMGEYVAPVTEPK